MKALRAGQVALNPDLSGMPRLRFLRQVGAVVLILNMSEPSYPSNRKGVVNTS